MFLFYFCRKFILIMSSSYVIFQFKGKRVLVTGAGQGNTHSHNHLCYHIYILWITVVTDILWKADAILTTVVYDYAYFLFSRRLTSYLWWVSTYRMWFRLRYRFRTLNPIPNPNPKTDPDPNPNPKSNNNLCSAKRHPNKVHDSVINISYFVGQGVGA